MNREKIHFLREEYRLSKLEMDQTSTDPFVQFEKWMKEALQAEIYEANAMFLATADLSGMPSGRIVLLKDFDSRGFVFFTNYNSRKGQELTTNPQASITFFWKEIQRQVRIQGIIEKTSEQESDEYFLSRPEESRIGSIISPQSQVIPGREMLEDKFRQLDKTQSSSRPPHWGGFRLIPILFEYWQGREHRLHDRIRYRLDDREWIRERLAP